MTAFKRITVALLGAAGTGKKSLAQALNDALTQAGASTSPATFSASLQTRWQITTDTPLQRLIELAQSSATQLDGAKLDTESPAFKEALAQQRLFDHTLLLGLDLAPSALTVGSQSAGERSAMDALLRRSLTLTGAPFQVIYGVGDDRLRQALAALRSPTAKPENSPAETPSPRKPWVWACDKCSDPGCEHRLLSALLLNR